MGWAVVYGTRASSARVGSRSIALAIRSTTVPASMARGQRTKKGDRTPPSSVEPLRPFMPPFQRQPFGPLSVR